MSNQKEVTDYSNLSEILQALLEANSAKRVVVVGATCTGKSTFLKKITNAHDMDALIYPQLAPKETNYVNQAPWTKEIGETMERLAKERIKIKAGEPVFGTIVFDSDLIINLTISDELLKERTNSRGVSFVDAKNMQQQIEDNIRESGIPKIDFPVG